MAAQNRIPNTTQYYRELKPLPELRDMVNVSNKLDALCELLWEADAHKISATSVHELLKPMRDKLIAASCDLNDMRM